MNVQIEIAGEIVGNMNPDFNPNLNDTVILDGSLELPEGRFVVIDRIWKTSMCNAGCLTIVLTESRWQVK